VIHSPPLSYLANCAAAIAAELMLAACPWKSYKTDDGREYYHNSQTQDTVWTKPKELADLEVLAAGGQIAPAAPPPPSADATPAEDVDM